MNVLLLRHDPGNERFGLGPSSASSRWASSTSPPPCARAGTNQRSSTCAFPRESHPRSGAPARASWVKPEAYLAEHHATLSEPLTVPSEAEPAS